MPDTPPMSSPTSPRPPPKAPKKQKTKPKRRTGKPPPFSLTKSTGGTTPIRKKKRPTILRTKQYTFKESKRGKTPGTGPKKGQTSGVKKGYKHEKLPNISARDLSKRRVTRSKTQSSGGALVSLPS